uniref:Tripartite motif containing 59 n=1 Tax=Salmo trutta TaxID=8032 RepID=A0A673ZJB9_SALTR
MDNLEEDLTCSVCYSLFADPRGLPCSHTFCKSCLDNVLQVSAIYSIWQLPPTGVDALRINISLHFQKDSHPRPPSCPEHHRQPLNVCVQDWSIPRDFINVRHRTPVDRERHTPAPHLTRRSCSVLPMHGEQLEQKASCEGLMRQGRQAVEQYFHGLELVLARKIEAFMGALDTASVEVFLAYDPLVEEEQLDLLSLGSAVEDEDSPLVLLEKFYLFWEVEALVNPPLPKVLLHLHLSHLADVVLREIAGELAKDGTFKSWAHDLLLQLLLAVWVNPVGGASLGFSLLSKLSQMLHGLRSELTASLWETAGFLYAQTVEVQLFSTLGENTFQQLASFKLMTERHMGLHVRKDPSTW